MTEPDTQTVQTEYGEATIETYDCDSCGNTVAYEETVEFTIGDREGRACSHCDDNGPISFPQNVREWSLPEDPDDYAPPTLFSILIAPITLPIYCFLGLSEDHAFDQGVLLAVLAITAWGLSLGSAWVLL